MLQCPPLADHALDGRVCALLSRHRSKVAGPLRLRIENGRPLFEFHPHSEHLLLLDLRVEADPLSRAIGDHRGRHSKPSHVCWSTQPRFAGGVFSGCDGPWIQNGRETVSCRWHKHACLCHGPLDPDLFCSLAKYGYPYHCEPIFCGHRRHYGTRTQQRHGSIRHIGKQPSKSGIRTPPRTSTHRCHFRKRPRHVVPSLPRRPNRAMEFPIRKKHRLLE